MVTTFAEDAVGEDELDGETQDRLAHVRSRFISISGRNASKGLYLPVQARLDWFRTDWPEGTIDQELVAQDEKQAIFKCRVGKVKDGVSYGHAEGYGQEFAKSFDDYLLKASTVALGRALNALGFGGDDLLEGVDEGNIADAPLTANTGGGNRRSGTGTGPTPRQSTFIDTLAKERGIDAATLDAEAVRQYGQPLAKIAIGDVSAFIDWLKTQRRGEGGGQPSAPPQGQTQGQSTPLPSNEEARARANRRVHAAGTSAGLTDAALHLMAISQYPTHGEVVTTSRGELTGAELQNLAGLIERDCRTHLDIETGEVVPSPRTLIANAIAAAATPSALDTISHRMASDGVLDPWLVGMGRAQKAHLQRVGGGGSPATRF